MVEQAQSPFVAQNRTAVARTSDRELVVTRLFDAPPGIVFRAWSEAALFRRWWVPEGAGITLVGCEMDVRTGGRYRLEFAAGDATMAFHGKYLEVVPDARIVWTNDEAEAGAVTTVTFEDRGGKTLLTFHELYPSPQALDEAMAGSAAALPAQLDQLAVLLSTVGD
jgi:uncharacterized protein YndB with AHSA1/START domain